MLFFSMLLFQLVFLGASASEGTRKSTPGAARSLSNHRADWKGARLKAALAQKPRFFFVCFALYSLDEG